MRHKILCTAALCLLGGCAAADKLAQVGKAPAMDKITNPTTQPNFQPVSLPMPAPRMANKEKNSLWQSGRVTFFKDQRAADVGDIITVMIDIKDEAQIENTTARSRTSSTNAALPSLLGYEIALDQVLPEAVNNTNLAEMTADSDHSGTGTIDRQDEISMRMAALITQLLPNGNMVIHGKQEVLVNFEKRILLVEGVIRPQDISVENTVNYDQIAEARITYSGEGQITDVQQPKYGQQLYDIVFPF